jgi:alkanesulfonate monooxygenase SsuD/methylene tetrahydromethanopterin reductase-like flavin-dependent oxidoreductase (luciferase family)
MVASSCYELDRGREGGTVVEFGFAVPIFANPGVTAFRTPNFERLEWQPIRSAIEEAERLGYSSVWVADHMFLGRDGAILEGWTTLAAIAGFTSRMRLGPIHLGNGFRHAALTAKMVATLDVISGGRVELFIDPGWRAREHVEYGFPWNPSRQERVAQLGEAIALTRSMWSGRLTSFVGTSYTLSNAICMPVPVKPNGPRIWIGEAFDEPTLDLIAREADVWNSMPASADVLREKIQRVDAACEARGRDPSTLVKTLETQVLICDDEADLTGWLDRFARLREQHPVGSAMSDVVEFVASTEGNAGDRLGIDDYRNEFVIGNCAEVAAKLRAYRDLGISEVICWFMDFPEGTTMRRLMNEVIPTI